MSQNDHPPHMDKISQPDGKVWDSPFPWQQVSDAAKISQHEWHEHGEHDELHQLQGP